MIPAGTTPISHEDRDIVRSKVAEGLIRIRLLRLVPGQVEIRADDLSTTG